MRLRDVFREFRDRVEFQGIYIREAHPVDGWSFAEWPGRPVVKVFSPKAALDVQDPKTLEERRQVAARCEETLSYEYPTLVDTIDDHVSEAYAAKPTRLYLIGVDGKVVYAGGPGPMGYKPAAFREAIASYLEGAEVSGPSSEPVASPS